MENPIGIFDSGVGGLTVLKAIRKLLPNENLVYLGDTARVPYGNKSRENIVRYSIENTQFLMKHNIKMLVVACNTSTAMSLNVLKERFSIPIIGVIEPGAKRALEVTKSGRIGVIGTEATVKSGVYAKVIKEMRKDAVVFSKACPLFVPIVEEGLTKGKIAEEIVKHYLYSFKVNMIDTIVLGCTHYPLLKGLIRRFFKGDVRVVDSASETAKAVKLLLEQKGLLNTAQSTGKSSFYVTDAAERFLKIGKTILGDSMATVNLVSFEK
ncbi:MAG: glutamate racemase [bacterium]